MQASKLDRPSHLTNTSQLGRQQLENDSGNSNARPKTFWVSMISKSRERKPTQCVQTMLGQEFAGGRCDRKQVDVKVCQHDTRFAHNAKSKKYFSVSSRLRGDSFEFVLRSGYLVLGVTKSRNQQARARRSRTAIARPRMEETNWDVSHALLFRANVTIRMPGCVV